jgi:hypothetical protein
LPIFTVLIHIIPSVERLPHRLFTEELPKLGIEVTFADPMDARGWRQAVRPNTRGLFVETPVNLTARQRDLKHQRTLEQQVASILARRDQPLQRAFRVDVLGFIGVAQHPVHQAGQQFALLCIHRDLLWDQGRSTITCPILPPRSTAWCASTACASG